MHNYAETGRLADPAFRYFLDVLGGYGGYFRSPKGLLW